MTEQPINEHVIKLSGKASLPAPLIIGENYRMTLNGTVVSKTESDNQDGTSTLYYKFEPINVELVDDMGSSIRSKDTRSNSALLRSYLWKLWKDSCSSLEFVDFYDGVMSHIMREAPAIIERYEARKR
jgi:hypothetical protein